MLTSPSLNRRSEAKPGPFLETQTGQALVPSALNETLTASLGLTIVGEEEQRGTNSSAGETWVY